MSQHRTIADDNLKGYPPGIPYIIGNEGCERFSYYGMKAILYVFLWKTYMEMGLFTDQAAAQTEATAIYHDFVAAVYALPMIGAIFADRLLGKYNVIMWLSVVYCIGHALLAIFETNLTGFYWGLGLIAVGAGGIKPCVSAHVGDQFGKNNVGLLTNIYKAFYFIINFGSMFATILIPLLYKWYGPAIAFGLPGILMGIATVFFWIGRHSFVHIPAEPSGKLGLLDSIAGSLMFLTVGSLFFTGSMETPVKIAISGAFLVSGLALFLYRQKIQQDDGFLALTLVALKDLLKGKKAENPKPGTHETHWFYGTVAKKFGHEKADGPMSVWSIMSVFFLVSIFWALFEQHSSTWIRQAESLSGDISIFGFNMTLLPSQMPTTNPVLVMILIPFTTYILYPMIDKFYKLNPLRTMTIGIIMAGISFGSVYVIEQMIASQGVGQVSMLWQIIPYTLLTLSEVMVSITGLEFAYTQAPKRMKSTIMGFWLLTVSLGSVLTSLLARFGGLELDMFFLLFAGLSVAAGIIFGIRARYYKIKAYTA